MITKHRKNRSLNDDSNPTKSKKKRKSHPSSTQEPDIDFRKLVDKLEQAEINMKLEEIKTFKLQKVNNIETTISERDIIHDSGIKLAEKKSLKNESSTRKIQSSKVNDH